ncbi:hypothetical protein D3C86_1065410 [compost metagenome]
MRYRINNLEYLLLRVSSQHVRNILQDIVIRRTCEDALKKFLMHLTMHGIHRRGESVQQAFLVDIARCTASSESIDRKHFETLGEYLWNKRSEGRRCKHAIQQRSTVGSDAFLGRQYSFTGDGCSRTISCTISHGICTWPRRCAGYGMRPRCGPAGNYSL